MRLLPWSLLALLFAGTLHAQPRAQLPDPVAFPENRWIDLGRVGDHDVVTDREALSAESRERGVWVRRREAGHHGSAKGLFIYDYYTIDCEGGRSRYHMRLYVFDRVVHNRTGMTAEWAPIAPESVPSRLCELKPTSSQRAPSTQPDPSALVGPIIGGSAAPVADGRAVH